MEIAFDPKECKSAIVTCGGLCPGLNSVIREVVMCLRRQYGVTKTLGIPSGYRGFLNPDTWISLDEEYVKNFHNMGGSILGSSRGGHDTNAIVDNLVDQGINLLFIVGGDGTVRGAEKIAQVSERIKDISLYIMLVQLTLIFFRSRAGSQEEEAANCSSSNTKNNRQRCASTGQNFWLRDSSSRSKIGYQCC